MENLPAEGPDINLVYTINEPAGSGCVPGAEGGRQGEGRHDRLGRRRLPGREAREGGQHRRDLAAVPAEDGAMGVEAVAQFAKDGTKPEPTEGKTFFDTGVTLITDQPATASTPGHHLGPGELLGLTGHARRRTGSRRAPWRPRPAGDAAAGATDPDALRGSRTASTSHRRATKAALRRTTARSPSAHPARPARRPELGPLRPALAIVAFSLSPRFFEPRRTCRWSCQQVAVIGSLARRPDADHPHRGHRPVGRRDHGASPRS